ncbi:MAG: VCBS repeat-containing protein [Chthoniobacterales bacterium]|nr:VCBS repeat-containing protein [Chthoniobacterales bacterium]
MIKKTITSDLFWPLACGLLIIASAAHAVAQNPTFTTQTHPFLGNNHIAADLNGDGKLDLAGTGANAASVMLNKGDGTFQPKIDYPVVGQVQDLAAGDFNGDGKTDLVVTINTPQNSLSLLTGNGNGTFNAAVNFPNTSGFDSPSIVATDLNNDGKLDVVIAHQIACYTAPCIAARTISALLGNGNGTFQPTREIDVGTGMSRIAVGDFNRDGKKDLAICGSQAQLFTLIGAGDGTFVQQPTITLVGGNTLGVDGTDVDVSDLNGDTLQDLVVALGVDGSLTAILIGNGDGSFRAPSLITEPNLRYPVYQAVADYNGDGKQDLALGLGWGLQGLMEILNGNGDGTFQSPVLYLVPPPNSSIAGGTLVAADFNGDGKSDIALQVVGASPALDVLINATGAPALDTVSITRAEYIASKSSLNVEATSSRSTAVLQVFVTSSGQLIGTLSNNGGRFSGKFNWAPNPQNITVRSSFGGTATKAVKLK